MILNLDLSAEMEDRLREKAAERGVSPESYIQGMLENTLASSGRSEPSDDAIARRGEEVPAGRTEDREDAMDSATPWRGVFAMEYGRPALFVKSVPVDSLPRWEPQITISPRWVAEDDD